MEPSMRPLNDVAKALPMPAAAVMAMLLMLVRLVISSFSLPMC